MFYVFAAPNIQRVLNQLMMTVGCWLFSWLVGWLTNKRTDWLDGLLVWFAHTYLLTYLRIYRSRWSILETSTCVLVIFFFNIFCYSLQYLFFEATITKTTINNDSNDVVAMYFDDEQLLTSRDLTEALLWSEMEKLVH